VTDRGFFVPTGTSTQLVGCQSMTQPGPPRSSILSCFFLFYTTLRSIISGSTRAGLISHRRHLIDSLPFI